LLLRRWARVKAGDSQVVLISGEPGIRKSRITAALAERERLQAEPYLRLRYFCSPYHQDSALCPAVDQLGRASGFAREDPPAAKLEKLEALLARGAPPDEEDVAFLADLLSLASLDRHQAIYAFKHALVQDAAHGSMLRSTRQQYAVAAEIPRHSYVTGRCVYRAHDGNL
jgi:predicted ATPase